MRGTTRGGAGSVPPHQSVLLVAGRGELPFTLLHGQPLYVHALTALVAVDGRSAADVVVVVEAADEVAVTRELSRRGLAARVLTAAEWWAGVRAAPGGEVLLHDPLCPLASTEWLASVREVARAEPGASVASYRPVTDTVKTVVDSRIGATIDREGLAAVVAPVVVAGRALADPPVAVPPLHDLGSVVDWLRGRGPVVMHRAPSLARRVEDASAVNLLECVDELNRRVRHDA